MKRQPLRPRPRASRLRRSGVAGASAACPQRARGGLRLSWRSPGRTLLRFAHTVSLDVTKVRVKIRFRTLRRRHLTEYVTSAVARIARVEEVWCAGQRR